MCISVQWEPTLPTRLLSQNDLNNKMNKLHLLESALEKIDFYSDIDTNTNLDIDFKNIMTKLISTI